MSDDVEPSPPHGPGAGGDVDRRLDDLDRKLDTVAGAMAAVATTQTELLEQGRQVLREVSEAAAAKPMARSKTTPSLAIRSMAGSSMPSYGGR